MTSILWVRAAGLGVLLSVIGVSLLPLESNLFGMPDSGTSAQATITVNIDVGAGVHSISPLIYGVGGDSQAYHRAMGASVERWGGNQTTRSNWENNDSNAGSDWGPF